MNESISQKSAVEQFRDAIAAKGITPPDSIVGDGKFHRFSSNGKPHDDAGWYLFHDGAIATGAFGDFRTGVAVPSWVTDMGRALTPVEKSDFQKKQEDMRVQREADTVQRRAAAKDKAAAILRLSKSAGNDHPYLVRKGVKAHGVEVWKDLLVIRMIDDTGKVQSLQLIAGDGTKKFLKGGKMQGCYFTLGTLDNTDKLLIAEGYATAATIHEATGLPVIVAYNAGNLLPVARAIRAKHPHASIILCADDDIKTKGNPGLTKAKEAAEAVNGVMVLPDFGANRPDGATDFNDMAAHRGKDAVTDFFKGNADKIFLEHEDFVDEEDAFLANPSSPDKPPVEAPKAEKIKPAYGSQPKLHFSSEELPLIHVIWKDVPRRTSCHFEHGYHLIHDKHKVLVTRDRIKFAGKAKHRPDEAYLAACKHARQFWDGRMEVHGDMQHRIKAWAYASANGIIVTNFSPSEGELIDAEKILNRLRPTSEPAFRRPAPVGSHGLRPHGGLHA